MSAAATPAGTSCDVRASKARLDDARRLVTALRLGETTDPHRIELARDLRALGITPAVSTGWHQQAVDVSDQLRGTTDPDLRRVAVALARAGVGPTPADLLRDEPTGPVQDLVADGDRAGDLLAGAVAAAGDALSVVPPAPSAYPADPAHVGDGRTPQPRPPRACTPPGGPGTGHTTAPADPTVTDEPGSGTPSGPPDQAAPDDTPDSDSATPTGTDTPDGSDSSPDDSGDPSPSPGTDGDGSGRPGDPRAAAAVVRAVEDLLRSLSDQSTPDAQRLAGELRTLLSRLGSPTGAPEGTESPGPASPDPTGSPRPTGTDGPTDSGDPGNPGDWRSLADELAKQAGEAADGDPLAGKLASELGAAGFGDGQDEDGTGTPGADAHEPSSAPASSTADSPAPDAPAADDSAADDPEPGAGAASPATWDRLADCESSGDWAADTGNGYSGGLQFDRATWDAFGGRGSAARASRAEQIAVARKVQAARGWAAWPACSGKWGLR